MDIFRNVSGIFIVLQNPDNFKTLVYLNSNFCQISSMESIAKIVKGCNYFRDISFSRFLLYEINIMKFSNTGLIFPPELFILCKKKVWGPRGLRAADFEIPLTITAFH